MGSAEKQKILLESGTNELEVLVFTLAGQRYGVNVAKVREVVEPIEVTRLPQSHPSVTGVFQLRNTISPLVDLQHCLKLGGLSAHNDGKIVIMEFNDTRVGFLVNTVEQIYRVSWKDVAPLPNVDGVNDAPVTSIAHINDDMVLMLDFEKLVFDIGGVDLFEASADKITQSKARGDQRILLAEDSRMMRQLIQGNLVKAGYTNVTVAVDGQEAWEKLEYEVALNDGTGYALLITDIEMPRIDGLHLTRRIREHAGMKGLPIIIFSSLVSNDNEKKCEAVGADAQITKPQLAQLVDLIDKLLEEARAKDPGAAPVMA